MRNKFEGKCYRCGETVPAGAGHFERIKGPIKWRVQHAQCAIDNRKKREYETIRPAITQGFSGVKKHE